MQCQRSLHLNFKKWQPLQEHLKQFYSNKFEIKLNFPQLSELMISFFSLRLLAFRLEHLENISSVALPTLREARGPRGRRLSSPAIAIVTDTNGSLMGSLSDKIVAR